MTHLQGRRYLLAGGTVTKFGNELDEVFAAEWIAINAARPQLQLVGGSQHQLFDGVHWVQVVQTGTRSEPAIALHTPSDGAKGLDSRAELGLSRVGWFAVQISGQ